MTKERVMKAAAIRGIRFYPQKRWLNNTVGYGYEFFTPNGRGFRQADTLDGIYKEIMEFPRIKED